jgi:hypothetical protein
MQVGEGYSSNMNCILPSLLVAEKYWILMDDRSRWDTKSRRIALFLLHTHQCHLLTGALPLLLGPDSIARRNATVLTQVISIWTYSYCCKHISPLLGNLLIIGPINCVQFKLESNNVDQFRFKYLFKCFLAFHQCNG